MVPHKMMINDTVNAFVSTFTVEGAEAGPLAGKTFGAKDLYDIKGHMTGCGSPDWARTHDIADTTAPAVQALLDAGATLIGKTHTDEIAYSLMGVNAHYGTPVNPAAPDRVPGGSSSGSVSATAAGLIDIGLGSDTGGSVRMPASFCGVFGIRTTHGRIDLANVMPLAPSFDTVGWFTRDAETFAATGAAYGITAPETPTPRLMIANDAFDLASDATRDALGAAMNALQASFGAVSTVQLADAPFAEWREIFLICQAAEVWQAHKDCVTSAQPSFGPGAKERFDMAASISPEMLQPAISKRAQIRARLIDLLGDDGIIMLPSSPGPAPKRNAKEAELDIFRMAALELLCAAGLASLPQISIPAGTVEGAPVGLSLIAGPGQDGLLLALAKTF